MFNYTSYVLVGVESLYRITDELRTDTGHDHMRRADLTMLCVTIVLIELMIILIT